MSLLKNPPVRWHKIVFLLLVVFIFTGFDLGMKELAQRRLKYQPDEVVIPGFWSFHYTENDDIGFSVFRFLDPHFSEREKFIFIVALQLAGTSVAVWIFFYLNHWKYNIPLAFIISGGLGNALDRLMRGYVVDYVKWYIGSFVWPIFNLADVYTVLGAGTLFIILVFFSRESEQPDRKTVSPEQ